MIWSLLFLFLLALYHTPFVPKEEDWICKKGFCLPIAVRRVNLDKSGPKLIASKSRVWENAPSLTDDGSSPPNPSAAVKPPTAAETSVALHDKRQNVMRPSVPERHQRKNGLERHALKEPNKERQHNYKRVSSVQKRLAREERKRKTNRKNRSSGEICKKGLCLNSAIPPVVLENNIPKPIHSQRRIWKKAPSLPGDGSSPSNPAKSVKSANDETVASFHEKGHNVTRTGPVAPHKRAGVVSQQSSNKNDLDKQALKDPNTERHQEHKRVSNVQKRLARKKRSRKMNSKKERSSAVKPTNDETVAALHGKRRNVARPCSAARHKRKNGLYRQAPKKPNKERQQDYKHGSNVQKRLAREEKKRKTNRKKKRSSDADDTLTNFTANACAFLIVLALGVYLFYKVTHRTFGLTIGKRQLKRGRKSRKGKKRSYEQNVPLQHLKENMARIQSENVSLITCSSTKS